MKAKAKLKHMSTGIQEVDRVTGGGLVPGQVVLLWGEPGGGKSTLAMQVCGGIARGGRKVFYTSGEQETEDILLNARCLGISNESIEVCGERAEVSRLIDQVRGLGLTVLVVDSINSAYMEDVEADVNSAKQKTAVVRYLKSFAKETGVSVLMVCQMTKNGTIAVPAAAAHVVDSIFRLDGGGCGEWDDDFREKLAERDLDRLRVLVVEKNRFGPESGDFGTPNAPAIFRMTGCGLLECIQGVWGGDSE